MESYEDRLRRFQDNGPGEVIGTLLNSINNLFNPEIQRAADQECWSLMMIGTHGVALTIVEGVFGVSGEQGFVRFLKEYMDGAEPGGDWSTIGHELHEWRNVLAHQWLSAAGYGFAWHPGIDVGWERRGDLIVVNPIRYHAAYRQAWSNPNLWLPNRIITDTDFQKAKRRLIRKFQGR